MNGGRIERLYDLYDGLLTELNPEPWMRDASCVVTGCPDDWFATTGRMKRFAVRVCRGCPVWRECRSYAQDLNDHGDHLYGIWGGTTPLVRQRVSAHHRKAAS